MPSPTPGLTLSNFMVGDPQWIGILQRPQYAHSPDNQFIARYTYAVVPVGQTLDLNSIHNIAKFPLQNGMGGSDGFFRNQGVMTSELNLAAFLSDLNTNVWPSSTPSEYNFRFPILIFRIRGPAPRPRTKARPSTTRFSLLYYRYNGSTKNLARVTPLFGNPGVNAFKIHLMCIRKVR